MQRQLFPSTKHSGLGLGGLEVQDGLTEVERCVGPSSIEDVDDLPPSIDKSAVSNRVLSPLFCRIEAMRLQP